MMRIRRDLGKAIERDTEVSLAGLDERGRAKNPAYFAALREPLDQEWTILIAIRYVSWSQ